MRDTYLKLSLAIFLCAVSTLGAQGIQFQKMDWKAALAKATLENKLIFVDAYADWCGPCKQMDRTIFPDQNLGAFHNANFINIKMNVEQGEGRMLSAQYRIQALPTLLYINGKGEVVHKSQGYQDAITLLAVSKEANDPQSNLLYFKTEYANQKHDPTFLKRYTKIAKNLRLASSEKLLQEYLNTQEEKNTPENIELIYSFVGVDMEGEMFKYMLENRSDFYKVLGENKIDDRIKSSIYINYNMLGREILEQKVKEIYPLKSERVLDDFNLNDLIRENKSGPKFNEFVTYYFNKYEVSDWNIYNTVAWQLYEGISDKKILNQALSFAEKSIALNNNYYNNDTLAAIHYKLRNKDEAQMYALSAIALAKQQNIDPVDTQHLLQLIKGI